MSRGKIKILILILFMLSVIFFSCIKSVDSGDAGDGGSVDGGDAGDGGSVDGGDAGDGGSVDGGDAGDGGSVDTTITITLVHDTGWDTDQIGLLIGDDSLVYADAGGVEGFMVDLSATYDEVIYDLTYDDHSTTVIYDIGSQTATYDVAITYDDNNEGYETGPDSFDGAYQPRSADFDQFTFEAGNLYTVNFTSISETYIGERRTPAEWEELDGVWVAWTFDTGFITDMVYEIAQITKAKIMLSSSDDESSATTDLTDAGVNMSNVEFYVYDSSTYDLSVWMRDFAPIYMIEDGQKKILDFYHSYYCDDMPTSIGTHTGVPVFNANSIEMPGGNYISDGVNVSFVSSAVYDPNIVEGNDYQHNIDNYVSQADLLADLSSFTGNENNVLSECLDHEKTHHIDMWAKQLNPTTFMVGEYSSGTNVTILNNVTTQLENEGYTVVRVSQPPQDSIKITPEILKYHKNAQYLKKTKAKDLQTTPSYTNSLIVNGGASGKKVLVPSYSDFDTLNADAQAVYESVMSPEYEVIMIDCSYIITFGGAIHCTTMQEPAVQ